MTSDLPVFLGCENLNPATACRIVRGAVRDTILRGIWTDAGPSQAAADRGTDFRIIFTNAAGEYEQIDSFKRSGHRGHLLTHGIAKHLNSKLCIGV